MLVGFASQSASGATATQSTKK